MILLLDNYDSFVHNLARCFERLGREPLVVRNTEISVGEIRQVAPEAIVLSPGPCTPREAGCCLDVVRRLHPKVPILGICLGHQVIAEALGGRIVRAAEPFHGRTSSIHHDGQGVFEGLPNPFVACRYHSLTVEPDWVPDCLKVSARTEDGVIMGVRHRDLPLVGLQFHPESILTDCGYRLLAGFLKKAGLEIAEPIPAECSERSF